MTNYKKSSQYISYLVIVSVVYSLLVFQIASQSAEKQKKTGDNNICYFNNLCQKPYGKFLNFNQVFSNLGYVVFGTIFIGIIHFHKYKFDQLKAREGIDFLENKYGIPHQYGIYYSMGGALIMEGLMSLAFHICPTNVNFQFDTTYMYLIAILMYIKIYQNRHPDISCNAETAFYIFVGALILEVVSVYHNTPAFWIVFCSLYIISTSFLAAILYNRGAVRTDKFMPLQLIKIFMGEIRKCSSHAHVNRIIPRVRPVLLLIFVVCLLNIGLCISFLLSSSFNKVGASNYLLIMFISNMFLYLFYYVIMKIVNKEVPCYQAWIYAGLAHVCSISAMYFFYYAERNTSLSPAESRDMNRPCIWLDYYDRHDVWHFISAGGVFFTMMFIFTLDEDLKYKKRSEIPVF